MTLWNSSIIVPNLLKFTVITKSFNFSGDFAVLLKTGMQVKQALFYNVVSSVLCFLGMMIGIALQGVETASYWIFAITAGTFVYIALVDMVSIA